MTSQFLTNKCKPMFKTKIHSREDLKKFFQNGRIPSENHFSHLIDSMINKQDDGFTKDEENGLIISTRGGSKRFLTLYKNMDDIYPFYHIEKDEQQAAALRFTPANGGYEEQEAGNSFFLHENGSLGIGTRISDNYKLQVNGFAGMDGRTGTFIQDQAPADGKWHTIIGGLDNCQGFEIIARTGKKGFGRFALLHAIALSTFGKSSNRIRKVSAYYGSFWNRLGLRWKSASTHDYALQIRTHRNYGHDVMIHFKVTKLWDDEKFLPDDWY